MKNKYNTGLEIFAINGGLIGYVLTSDGELLVNMAICIVSSLIAVAINVFCYMHEKSNKLTLSFLIFNILILVILLIALVILII